MLDLNERPHWWMSRIFHWTSNCTLFFTSGGNRPSFIYKNILINIINTAPVTTIHVLLSPQGQAAPLGAADGSWCSSDWRGQRSCIPATAWSHDSVGKQSAPQLVPPHVHRSLFSPLWTLRASRGRQRSCVSPHITGTAQPHARKCNWAGNRSGWRETVGPFNNMMV